MKHYKIIVEDDGIKIDDLKLTHHLISELNRFRDPDTKSSQITLMSGILAIASFDREDLIDRSFYALINQFYDILLNLDGIKTSKGEV